MCPSCSSLFPEQDSGLCFKSYCWRDWDQPPAGRAAVVLFLITHKRNWTSPVMATSLYKSLYLRYCTAAVLGMTSPEPLRATSTNSSRPLKPPTLVCLNFTIPKSRNCCSKQLALSSPNRLLDMEHTTPDVLPSGASQDTIENIGFRNDALFPDAFITPSWI